MHFVFKGTSCLPRELLLQEAPAWGKHWTTELPWLLKLEQHWEGDESSVLTELCSVTCASAQLPCQWALKLLMKQSPIAAGDFVTLPWVWQNINSSGWNRTSEKVGFGLYVLTVMVLFQIWHFKKLLKVFCEVSPLAGWHLAVQHSYNTVELPSSPRNASDCCSSRMSNLSSGASCPGNVSGWRISFP